MAFGIVNVGAKHGNSQSELESNLNAGGYNINNLADPVENGDAVNKSYVDKSHYEIGETPPENTNKFWFDTKTPEDADEPDYVASVSSVSLYASKWDGEGPFTQNVSIKNATENSKVDLQPDYIVFNQMINDGTSALYIVNDGGNLIAYAVGNIPTADLVVQATVMEVSV